MAATILGITTLTFGVPSIAGLIVNSANFTESVNIAEVIDEDGDYVAAALHGRKITGTVSGVTNGTPAALGATLAVSGAPSGTYYITERSQSRTADGFSTFDLGLSSWGGI
jgi:hypothetical protein